MLASWAHGEDAALWSIDDERIGILTVDFITPVVDDPRKYGEIAAANALSDVFAMGGRPLVALNVVGFPTSCEPIGVLQEIMQGGAEKVIEAGAVLAGGHSVQDDEPKYGLVVFGEVRRGEEWRVDTARGGDVLILTKPIGTGIAATAIKAGLMDAADVAFAVECMATLNDPGISKLPESVRRAIHACTDVTGFGLAGHALDMLGDAAVGMTLSIEAASLPILPGVAEMAAMGMVPAGSYANREHSGAHVRIETKGDRGEGFDRLIEDVVFDPQTSGGLLLAVDPGEVDALLFALRRKFPGAVIVGRFEKKPGQGRTIRVI